MGSLYDKIYEALHTIEADSLFIGDPNLQIDRAVVDFPDLVPVYDLSAAAAAIRSIQHQGEGTRADHADCHYGMFQGIQREMSGAAFNAARDVIDDPTQDKVVDQVTREAMELFDDAYAWTLRVLAWVFGPGDPRWPETRALARAAIASMPLVIKPLGEALTAMPTGNGRRAGAAFNLHRHVHLPPPPRSALQISREGLTDLTGAARKLTRSMPGMEWLPRQLEALTGPLRWREREVT